MNDSLDEAIRLLALWMEPPAPENNKHARWQLMMGQDAPYNPELVITKVAGLLDEARVEVDELVGEIAVLEQRLRESRLYDE